MCLVKWILSSFAVMAVICASPTVQAQNSPELKGNGGDVIECPGQENVTLLDVFESQFPRPQHLYTQGFPGSFEMKLENLLSALGHSSSKYFALRLKKRIKELQENTELVDEELPDIPDSFETVLPEGCSIRQLGIQYKQGGVVKLKVNRALHGRLDADNLVAFYTHEGIFAEALELGHLDSIRTRRVNGGVLTQPQFVSGELLNDNGFIFSLIYKRSRSIPASTDLVFRPRSKGSFKELQRLIGNAQNGSVSINTCGVYILGAPHGLIECRPKEDIKVQIKDESIESISSTDLPSGFFGITLPVKTIYLAQNRIELQNDWPIQFDGSEFVCQKESQILFFPEAFKPGIGYIQNQPVVKSCLASYQGAFLPTRQIARLPNVAKAHVTEFIYEQIPNEAPTASSSPVGIKYISTNGWRVGFSLFEDLKFTHFEAIFADTTFAVPTVSGKYYFNERTSCNVKDRLKAQVNGMRLDIREASFEGDGCTLTSPRNASVPITMRKIVTDASGKWVSGIPATDQKLLFGTKQMTFEGEVEFSQDQAIKVKKGVPKEQMFATYQVGEKKLSRWLPASGAQYTWIENDVFELIRNPFRRDSQGQFWGRVSNMKVSLLTEESRPTVEKDAVSISGEFILGADLTLRKGKITEAIKLPVCVFQRETESVRVEVRDVPANTLVTVQTTQDSQIRKPMCYWLN